MQRRRNAQGAVWRHGLAVIAVVVSIGLGGALRGQSALNRTPLVVVCDDNYPPYVFRDAEGKVRGILPDQWARWEQETGVRVDLQAMDWAEAQRRIREGRADVIDTIFFTEERAKFLAFAPPYARIEVPIYAHESLGGISDIPSLKGFTIGVKAGDAVISFLTHHGIDGLKEYPSYEAIIAAARNQEIKVFSVDRPAAVYFLYKQGVADQYRQCFVLYTGEVHRAVPRNRRELLRLVQGGFDRIPRSEYRAIDRRWLGSPFMLKEILSHWAPWIVGGAAAVVALVLGNVLLGRLVHARTAQLRVSREYFATLFDAINDALFIHDAATYRILDVNRRMLTMYGFDSREEAMAALNGMTGGTPPFSMQDAFEWLRKARDEGPQLFEWQARHRDGRPFWVDTSIRKVKIGSDDRLIVTVRDITDRKRAAEEKEALHAQLVHAQKLESIGRLAGGVAHDFNNMLQAILGYTEMALEQVPPGQRLHDDLLEVRKAAIRSTDLTRQLRTFARRQPMTPTEVDLNEAIGSMSSMLRRLIGEAIVLDWRPGRDIGVVMMDPGQLDQVVVNLCLNSRDAIGAAGHITIETGNVEITAEEARRLVDLSPGSYVRLSVRDDGSGMTPEVRERIFEPFFTTKPPGRGTGLGLSTVYGIIKQNGGTIHLDSAPDRGTAFHIYLPRSSGQPAAAASAGAADTTAPPGHGLVLVVEDEEPILRCTARLLESLGYRTMAASSPMGAIRIFEQHPDQIDLLLTDVIMPEMTGPELVRRLLAKQPKLRYLFMSAHAANLLAGQGVRESDPGYIQKPFDRQTLEQKLRQILTPT